MLSGHHAEIKALAFSSYGGILASGDQEGTLKLWDYAAATELASAKSGGEDSREIEFITFSPDSARIAVVRLRPHLDSIHPPGTVDDLEIWQTKPLQLLQTFDCPGYVVCFTPNGQRP
jgi:WD40 repeat protein